jgi:CsoR family transcriptional regulator, copper-sensing transcriptional repressor
MGGDNVTIKNIVDEIVAEQRASRLFSLTGKMPVLRHSARNIQGARILAISDNKQQLLTRLKTAEGHLRGVQRMVEDNAYCIDTIQQIRAVQRALHRINSLILANHLNTCVTTAIRSDVPEERERVLQELLQVYDTLDDTR